MSDSMSIPAELKTLDESMWNYGQWAKRRMVINVCGSMERRYKAPDWDGKDPPLVLIPTWRAIDLQRIVQTLPMLERMCLWAQYQADDHGFAQRYCHQHGIRRKDQWRETQIRGLHMLKNRLRSTGNV